MLGAVKACSIRGADDEYFQVSTVCDHFFVVASAHAQTGAHADTYTSEIVVTAVKRTDVASKLPAAISVFKGDDLRTLGVTSVADLQNIATGVNIGRDVFGVNISIRGVITTDTTSKREQGIAFNVDGFSIVRPVVQEFAFFDTDRVEILHSSQGTLYGKSLAGGAINVITKRPTSEFGAGALFEVGNFDTRGSDAFVNVPLGDAVAFRVVGSFNNTDGFLAPFGGSTAKTTRIIAIGVCRCS